MTPDFNTIINGDKPVLVDFFATWCGPCRMQSPILEQVKNEIGNDATILKVDIDNNRDLAERYRVMSVPTLIVFRGGEPLWRASGVQQAETLVAKLREHMTVHA